MTLRFVLAAVSATSLACAAWQTPGEALNVPMRPGARIVSVPSGKRLYVEVRGEDRQRPPVVLLHGFGSNHEAWDNIEPALREGRRTLNVDLPGFGGSSRFPGDYSPAALAADMSAMLDVLGASQVDVVAHSWGASVALALALAHPERVRRLVLMSAWVFEEQVPPFFRWARVPLVGEALFTAFHRERPEDRFPQAFEDPRIVSQDLVEAIHRAYRRPGTIRAALAVARGMRFSEMEGRYRQVTQPTLLLWGAADRVSRLRFGERLAREMPNARLKVLGGVGHFPPLESPHETRALVARFLDQSLVRRNKTKSEVTINKLAPRAPEPATDAPGVTPIDEPVRATAQAKEAGISLAGFLRNRGDLGYNWDLNRGPTPTSGAGLWPAPYAAGGQSRTQTDLNMRLRLDGEARIGYGVSLHFRVHVLDNLRYGSTPEGSFPGAAVNQVSPDKAIDLRQAYGQVILPFVVLSAGRMGSLFDWGTGFFVNAGNGLDHDVGDVGDRILFTTALAGLLWSLLFEVSASGPSTEALRPDIRPALDLDPSDDVRTIAFAVARWDTPETRRRLLLAKRTRFNFGFFASYRWQENDLAPGFSPTMSGAIHRGLSAFATDLWARLDVGSFTLEAELAYVRMSIRNASLDPSVVMNFPLTGNQVGGVLRADFRAGPRWFARMELGFASGDERPGFGARVTTASPPQPGDLDGPQFDLTRTPADTSIDNFRFHPNYHVDLILWRRIVGTVTDAYYLRPMLRYRLASMLAVEGALIASFAVFPNSTPSGHAPLGVETDLAITYEQEHGFLARLEYGVLFPLSGFRDEVLGVEPTPAHSLRLILAYRY